MRTFLLQALLAAALAFPFAAAAKDQTIIRLQNGTAPRQVGIVPAGEDVDGSGPAALTVGDDGTIYILDQNNNRVLAVDAQRSQEAPQVLTLPDDVPAEDLAMVRNRLYLWTDEIVPLQRATDDGGERALRLLGGGAEVDGYTRSVFASMGSQPPGPINSIVDQIGRSLERARERPSVTQYVPSRGLGDLVATVTVKGEHDVTVSLRRGGEENDFLALAAGMAGRVGTVELLDVDTTGRPYVLVETIPESARRRAATLVARFSPSGAVERVFDLPIDASVAFSRRFVAIGPRGDVLFLRTAAARSDVLRLEGRAVQPGRRIEAAGFGTQEASKRRKRGLRTAVLPKTRDSIIERAVEFETATWTPDRTSYGSDPAPGCAEMRRTQRPTYLAGKLGGQVKGIPYCWGCSTSVESFYEGLQQGKVAGNVCTRSDPKRDMLGVDCSSFVSQAWGLAMHVTTNAMAQVTNPIPDPWSMQPGDALTKPGTHVLLFMKFTADRKVEVMEASPNACGGRVCRNTYTLGTLLARGYLPMRFKGIEE